MFNNLRKFEYKRKPEEALGFFLAYAFLFIVAQLLIGGIMANSGQMGEKPEQIAGAMSALFMLIGMGYCGGLAFIILRKKRMRGWPGWVLVGLSVVGGFANGIMSLGAVIGIGVATYMTTRPMGWPYGLPQKKRRPPQAQPRRMPSPSAPKSDIVEAPPVITEPIVAEEPPPVPPKPKTPSRKTRERIRPHKLDDDTNLL
jgi:hypothetical protein